MTLAYAFTEDHVIRYRLQADSHRVYLRLWEPTLPKGAPDLPRLPYLYALNFTFRTLAEAEAFLRHHLLTNGAFDVPDENFPAEGEVAILPYPTWGTPG